jgi:hypothetical protein
MAQDMHDEHLIHTLTEALLVAVNVFCPKQRKVTEAEYRAAQQMNSALASAKAYLVEREEADQA